MAMFGGHEVELEGEVGGVALGAHGERLTVGLRPGGNRAYLWVDARCARSKGFKEAAAVLLLSPRSDAPEGFARYIWDVSEADAEGFRALVALVGAWKPRAAKAADGEPLPVASAGPITVKEAAGGWSLSFPYDEALVAKVRRLKTSRWDGIRRVWTVKESDRNALARLLTAVGEGHAEAVAAGAVAAEQGRAEAKAASAERKFTTPHVHVSLPDDGYVMEFAYQDKAVAAVKALPKAEFRRSPDGKGGEWVVPFAPGLVERVRETVATIDAVLAKAAEREAAAAAERAEAKRRADEREQARRAEEARRQREAAEGIRRVSRVSRGRTDGPVGGVEWIDGTPYRITHSHKWRCEEPSSMGYFGDDAYDGDGPAWIVDLRCRPLPEAEARPLLDKREVEALAEAMWRDFHRVVEGWYDLLWVTVAEGADRFEAPTHHIPDSACHTAFAATRPADGVVLFAPRWSVPDSGDFGEYKIMRPYRCVLTEAEAAAVTEAMDLLEQPWITRSYSTVFFLRGTVEEMRERAALVARVRETVKATVAGRRRPHFTG